MSKWISGWMLMLVGFGCAEAPPPRAAAPVAAATIAGVATQDVPEPEPVPAESSEPEPAPIAIPTECAGEGPCVPPVSFARELCKRNSSELAFVLFKKGTPWVRAYLRRDMQAWYAGARLASPADLRLDEEVIVIEDRASGAPSELSIGPGSYDVLRWDGKCVSVMSDEVTLEKPPIVGVPEISWRRLDQETREILRSDPRVRLAQRLAQDRCRADSSSGRCAEATVALSRAIADYVRAGGEVPEPKLVAY